MTEISDKAFILAAGYGKRLRPYTLERPKPLVEVAGRSLLDRTLDQLNDVGINEAVINLHYLADQIPAHLADRNDVTFHYSKEPELLDTGGGVKNMLQHFEAPFFVTSGDSLLEAEGALQNMQNVWDPEIMDILILLQPVAVMKLTQGAGDYDLEAEGRLIRSLDKTGEYMFTSIRINHPRIFDGSPDDAFSYRDLMDQAQQKGRLFGLVNDGDWHHISTPEDFEAVNIAYKAKDDAA